MGKSNNLIGFLNFLSLILSIPIIGGGVWLSTTDCMKFLQWPLILIGLTVMAVSLAGIAGACYRNTFLMYAYLWAMFFAIAALVFFIIFAYSATEKGSGRPVMNRAYPDYSLQDYSGSWLADRVSSPAHWAKISDCLHASHACRSLHRNVGGVPELADRFYRRKLTPIQSGCCKPPTSCGYTYMNETFWIPGEGQTGTDPDCAQWSNEQHQLCYSCSSCKAGVLASLKKSWRRASVINIVVLVILVLVYIVALAAIRHNQQLDDAHGETRMQKARPSWLF
ncbi:tetraspanin-3-like [Salvia splendens]|uniref:tetraspanin-3-like n=1 Tax=Salvia splendens TaxID=180675 RepID=UPI001C2657DD|nr:tetraspanin-3-like [Salvia splendens]